MPILITSLRRARRIGLMTGAMLMVVAGCLSFALPASAAAPCGTNGVLSAVGNVLTCTYTTGGEDTFNAPLFVTTVHVVAVGQTGGTGSAEECLFHTGDGGSGARVAADLPVTQPTLFVEVPTTTPISGGPGCGGGGGGGGGEGPGVGGGASVVQRCSVNPFTCLLTGNPQTDPRLVVAGGGGGGAFNNVNGGNAGSGANPICNPGQSGQGAPMFAVAGGGGYGGGCLSVGSGGHGGFGPGGALANGQTGDSGSIPGGGNGGLPAMDPVPQNCTYPKAWNGAGGGAGFFGGGGGGGAAYCNGGAGGGGSSYAGPSATNTSMTLAPQNATPTVTISWIQPVNREYQFLTGRAFGLSFTQSNPTPVSVTDVDTGAVQTSMTQTVSAPCQTAVNAPVGGTGTTITDIHACAEVVTTGGNQFVSKSLAGATVRGLVVKIPGLPVVKALTVISGSKTTCAGSTGATYIAYLSIGSDVVIAHPQVVAPNTHLTVGPFSVNLNAQTPFTLPTDKGLIVDAITISFGPPSAVTGHLIVASSESDIGDCPGQVHVN